MKSITHFITQKLKLKVNEAKSAVARRQERKFLGFSFSAGPEVKRVITPKALDRFKRQIREITCKAKGVSIETTMRRSRPLAFGMGQVSRNYWATISEVEKREYARKSAQTLEPRVRKGNERRLTAVDEPLSSVVSPPL